jgi:arylsulfatase A-like enzyme
MASQTTKPNIVFVLTDDQGYGDLGCTGNPLIRTPNLDAFYQESTRMTNFHVGPTCAPTRAGLMTGHYANSTGVWHTIGGRSLLRKDEWTLAAALGENGYRTGIFGKWHLGDAHPYRPQDRGFAVSVVHGGGGISQTPDYWGNDYFDDTYYVNGEPQAFTGYCTDVFFGEAMKFIEDNKDKPFFCYVATNAPHAPYNVEDRYADLYRGQVAEDRARFYGMITNIDENFGRIQRKLRELGLEENTIVIFMTDNGTSGGANIDKQGFVVNGYNAGLRGLKNSPYDGGHRVPFFLRWPQGGLRQGVDVGEVSANIDFMPTLLDLCGVEVSAGREFHGRSLKPLLLGGGASDGVGGGNAEAWPERVLVTDSQRLVQPVKWRQSAVLSNRWRLINGAELYDASVDREQRHDVAGKHPDVVSQLRGEYDRWWDIVSGKFDEEIPISIGAEASGETRLNCHDWRNDDCDVPYHHGLIRQGKRTNGYWEVDVVREGRYRFEVRRWPREAGHAMTAGIDGDDVVWSKPWISEKNWSYYTGGVALPIRQAELGIGGREYVQEVADGDASAEFLIDLPTGETHLHTRLTGGEEGELTLGAYYVYITRVS